MVLNLHTAHVEEIWLKLPKVLNGREGAQRSRKKSVDLRRTARLGVL